MSTRTLTGSARSRFVYVLTPCAVVLLVAIVLFAQPGDDPVLNVMKTGLGTGTLTSSPAGINCGTDCDENYASSATVTLTASADPGSTFAGWDVDPDADTSTPADCMGTSTTCGPFSVNVARSVRPRFDLASPILPIKVFNTTTNAPSTRVFGPTDRLNPDEVIRPEDVDAYLTANGAVTSAALFVAALLPEFKRNWILMSRSESLQTGTAESPRILLSSADARFAFAVGMTQHGSYPGSHPNAIEYMQWDATQKNFRFHEIVVAPIGAMGPIPMRNRGISIDDEKCPRCHSTRNVLNLNRSVTPHVPGSTIGTDGIPPGTVKAKNKPNWDSYDSWGGMTPFNRDRIYQGSVEAAAFRKFFNPWTWKANDGVRSIVEQLRLQPEGVPAADVITRTRGGTNDGHINFAFDGGSIVSNEPAPTGSVASITTSYSFDGVAGTGAGTSVVRGGSFLTLHNSATPAFDEGRGVQFFDLLGGLDGNLNQTRIADEIVNHHFATGSVPIDVRPIALAITKGCLIVDATANTVKVDSSLTPTPPALTTSLGFFDARTGMTINELVADTRGRTQGLPRRKADIQKRDLDRSGDPYLCGPPYFCGGTAAAAANGLIQQYGSTTSAGLDTSMARIRQEVFRRPIDAGSSDATVMGGIYVDREDYSFNTNKVALYRYFLEPLGVSVDKWSMSVRGRSRTYTFADVFSTYRNPFQGALQDDLAPGAHPIPGLTTFECADLIPFVNSTIASVPPADGPGAMPTYTDIQRIFNKSCIECHGGLKYPPYGSFGSFFDLSEDENPPAGDDRLDRSYEKVTSPAFMNSDPRNSFLYQRICPGAATLPDPNSPCAVPAAGTMDDESCPFGLMPCGGPRLSHTDIATIRRWIIGGYPNTRGDVHIQTIDGVNYDFQSAGEFTLLRGQTFEIQARQAAVSTNAPLGPNGHTGLTSCVSVNSAVAVRVGPQRITYQPNSSGRPDPGGLQLRVDGNLVSASAQGIPLQGGGRIVQTPAPGGIQIEAPGGTVIVVTPNWWDYYQVWYLNIDTRNTRATQGVMGIIPPGNWLPALPDGSTLGPRPRDLHQRYVDLYEKFEDAWRVTDANTLFDHAPGMSTASFTVTTWPEENPRQCIAPPVPSGPVEKPPLKTLAPEVAQQHCRDLVAQAAKANCVQDVMVTGEPGFAQVYLRGEHIERRDVPTAPVLGSPDRFKTGLAAPVSFTWNATSNREGDRLIYRHCVWEVTDQFGFDKCAATPIETTSWRRGILYALLVALLVLFLLALLIYLGLKKQPALLTLAAVLAIAVVILAFFVGSMGSRTISRTVAGLQPGRAYYWKVVAEDGKGGTVHSETRRFEIR